MSGDVVPYRGFERGTRDCNALRRSFHLALIGDFDLFGQSRRVYSFENRCEDDNKLALGDGAHTIFLAATSPSDPNKGTRVNELLDYVASGKVSGELSTRLDDAVARVRGNQEWRLEYMWQEVRDQLNIDKGREQGLEEGRRKGEQDFATLISKLLKDNRKDDIAAASSDPKKRQELYKEYGIKD